MKPKFFKAGNGGDGCMSFSPKIYAQGGPNGGNGGKGEISYYKLMRMLQICGTIISKSIGRQRMVNLAEGAIKTAGGEIPAF